MDDSIELSAVRSICQDVSRVKYVKSKPLKESSFHHATSEELY